MLRHLSLLFVPAGVGVIQLLPLLAEQWLPVAASVLGGTLVTILVTAGTMRLLARDEAAGAERS